MRKEKVFIAGPMTGLEDYNRSSFFLAAEQLRDHDYIPVHCAWLVDGLDHQEYMRISLQLLLVCDAIYLLEDWELSLGASLERKIANTCGLRVIEERPGTPKGEE